MVLVRHGFGHIVGRIHLPFATRLLHLFRKKRTPPTVSQQERLRRVLEELGPTFTKFGQLLATRPDLLPEDYITELGRLHDHAEPLSFARLKPIIEEELGGTVEERFSWIDEEPLGSASVAQVHRARTNTGAEVVVKIQRPGIERTIARDLQLLNLVASLLAEQEDLAHFDPPGTVRVFERAIWRELDFRHELHSLKWIDRQNDKHLLRIPRAYPELSTRRVLTMEFLPGPGLKEAELTPRLARRLARNVTSALFKQIFLQGVFHADPHPGNLIFTEREQLGLIDFGSVARLSPSALGELVGFVTSVVQRDYTILARQIVRSGYVGQDVDLGELAAELMDFLDPYYNLPLSEIDVGPLVNSLFGILMRYKIRIPNQYVLLGRTLVTLEGTVRRLDPAFSLIDELKPQVKRLFIERWRPRNIFRDLRLSFYEITSTLGDLPGAVGDVLHRLQEGNLRTKIAVEDLKHIENRLDRLNVQLPMGLLASSLLLSGTILLVQRPESSYAVAAAIGSYAVSGLLGLWFLRPGKR